MVKRTFSMLFVMGPKLLGGSAMLLGLATPSIWAQLPPQADAMARRHGSGLGRPSGPGVPTLENWAGYAVAGQSFTHVYASWKVPRVNCNVSPIALSDFWVGFDGLENADGAAKFGRHPEQAGTSSDCKASGTQHYYMWSQLTSNNFLCSDVSAGDWITAEVSYDTATDMFISKVTDVSKRQIPPCVEGPTHVPKANRASAEWIVEKTSEPLADFDDPGFGFNGAYAQDATNSGPINAFPNFESITMVIDGLQEAVPSSLSKDGSSFTVKAGGLVDLGLSVQKETFVGLGPNSAGDGQVQITIGSCVSNQETTNCTLSGSFINPYSSRPGPYSFVTTYQGNGPSPIRGVSRGPGSSLYTFDLRNVEWNITLDDQKFLYPVFNIYFGSGTTCTGVSTCNAGVVGLTAGATITGPVYGNATYF